MKYLICAKAFFKIPMNGRMRAENWMKAGLRGSFAMCAGSHAIFSEFRSVASFVFFGLENQIFENVAIFFKISNVFLNTIKL